MRTKAIYLGGILVFAAAVSPFIFAEAEVNTNKEFAGIAAEILNPDKLFEALKKNITIPTTPVLEKVEGESVVIPSPEKALKEASPKLQEVNKDIKEETGVDFAKLIGWFASVLKVFFLTVVNLLETVSQAMQNSR